MKVICITDTEPNLTKDKKYEAEQASVMGDTMYSIIDDTGMKKNIFRKKFITLFKFREMRIKHFLKK